jgi:protein O-GlcNAc transferase
MNSQLQIMLQQAIQDFQDGNFDRADSILRRVLQVDSKNLPALHVSGLIKASQASYREAADFLRRAARISPKDPSIQYNLAKALSDSGSYEEALFHHKKVVTLAPDNPEAWLNYGITASHLNRYEDALVWYSNALSLKPNYAEAALNKSSTLRELKRYEEAIFFAEQALQANPDLVGGWVNMALALKELKRFDEAIASCDKALTLDPDYHEVWANKGVALHELNRYEEAIAHYDKALSLKPDYHHALAYKAVALKKLKNYDEAIAHYDMAVSLKPDYHEAWANKGIALDELKRYDEAIASYDTALSLKPDIDWLSGDLLHLKMRTCSWSDLDHSIGVISKKVMANEKVSNPFSLLALSDDAFLHKKCSEIYSEGRYPFNPTLGPIPKASKKEKIRIGYFSADFRNHAVSILTAELFELHDKNKFEIIAISFGADDKSPIRLRLSQAFNQFIDVGEMPDLEIAKLSRELQIDIAVDLGGHTAGGRVGIFSYRAAPIQVNWLGYPGTMGINFIDYIVADKTIIPDEYQKFYSEKVATLPNTYLVDDSKRIASSRIFTRKECGLSENAFIFCCFNNDFKFNPNVLDGWSRILLAAKNSILWISENNEYFRVNLIAEFQKRGVDSNRIIFAVREDLMADHLARYGLADLFLDTFPYNAHTTTVDSLKAGVPVLTRVGQSFASRVAASLLNAIGLPELITTSQAEYEALAIELALNPQKLAEIKLKLANNRLTTPLFDTPLFAKNLEAAYLQMYERYQADLQPDHIEIV